MSSPAAKPRPDWVLWSRLLIAAAMGALTLIAAIGDEVNTHYHLGSSWPWIDGAIGLLVLPALIYRRRWPVAVLLITAAAASVSAVAAGPVAVAVVSVCAQRRWSHAVLAGPAIYASNIIFTQLHVRPEERAGTHLVGLFLTVVLMLIGWLIGQWREDRRAAWGNAWRMVVALLVGLALWAALAEAGTARGFHEDSLWLLVDPIVGLLAVALLPLRRRWPLAIVAGTGVLALAAASAGGASMAALISVSTSRRWRPITLGAAMTSASGLAFGPLHDDPLELADVVTNLVFVAFATAFGLFIGARRELVAGLRAQVEAAEREQEARMAQARTHERARIAREMHDVLAHRISLVAMHAGALAYREDLPAEQVRSTATLLHETSHQALRELREVLGVLREQDGNGTSDAPEPPQPTLADLDELVDNAVAGGQRIELTRTVELDSLPVLVSRNAFRIVQEALTNARKHAPDAVVDVRIAGNPGGTLRLEIRNARPAVDQLTPAAPGAGLGLVGLRERATLSGGTLTAGADRAGTFVVRAVLPWNLDEEETT